MAFASPGKDFVQQKIHLRDFNLTLISSVALLFFSAFSYGFSDQSFASTQATSAFKKQFGDYKPKTKTYALPALYLSLLNSLKAGTQLFGVIVGNWISKQYGRRWCIFVMSMYALGALQYLFGYATCRHPDLLAEISPAHLRGGIGALYWLSIKCGGLLVTGIVRAVSKDKGNIAWRLPIGLILIFPVVVICLIWFIPEVRCSVGKYLPVNPIGQVRNVLTESIFTVPRWQLLVGRRKDALASLTRLRQTRAEKHRKASVSSEILAEFSHLSEAVDDVKAAQRQLKRSLIRRFFSIFNPDNLKRTLIVVFLLFFQQTTGQSFASQYGTLFVESLNTVNAFSVTLGTNAIDIGGIICCIFLSDRLGRKPVLIISALLQTVALLTMGGLGTANPSSSSDSNTIKAGIVAMLLLYSCGWSFGYAPLAYVVAAELPSPYLREYTLNVAYTVKLVMEFIISFTYPYLEDADKANLGGKLGFIYGSVAFLALIFSIFIVPETKNMELEEMDEAFSARITEHQEDTVSEGGNVIAARAEESIRLEAISR